MDTVTADGIRKFLRLTALISDPREVKWVRLEEDLVEALEVVAQTLVESARMIGKQKYRGQPFDLLEDTKKELEEYLLTGREPVHTALARKKNLMMYHLVVEPAIDSFKKYEPQDIAKHAEEDIKEMVEAVLETSVPSHYDDALVTRAQVREMIEKRTAERKAAKPKRKPARRRTKQKEPEDTTTFTREEEAIAAEILANL